MWIPLMETMCVFWWNKMKLCITRPSLKKPVVIRFPSSVLTTKVFWKEVGHLSDADIQGYIDCVKTVQKFVKENGHFTLVEIVRTDGTEIKVFL